MLISLVKTGRVASREDMWLSSALGGEQRKVGLVGSGCWGREGRASMVV